jgi:hypothetical protein
MMNFINDNDLTHALVDPTNGYQKIVKRPLIEVTLSSQEIKKWKLSNLNPESPCL